MVHADDCTHPAFEPERYLGTLTSEYICVLCGRSFSREHAMYILEKNEAARDSSPLLLIA